MELIKHLGFLRRKADRGNLDLRTVLNAAYAKTPDRVKTGWNSTAGSTVEVAVFSGKRGRRRLVSRSNYNPDNPRSAKFKIQDIQPRLNRRNPEITIVHLAPDGNTKQTVIRPGSTNLEDTITNPLSLAEEKALIKAFKTSVVSN